MRFPISEVPENGVQSAARQGLLTRTHSQKGFFCRLRKTGTLAPLAKVGSDCTRFCRYFHPEKPESGERTLRGIVFSITDFFAKSPAECELKICPLAQNLRIRYHPRRTS